MNRFDPLKTFMIAKNALDAPFILKRPDSRRPDAKNNPSAHCPSCAADEGYHRTSCQRRLKGRALDVISCIKS